MVGESFTWSLLRWPFMYLVALHDSTAALLFAMEAVSDGGRRGRGLQSQVRSVELSALPLAGHGLARSEGCSPPSSESAQCPDWVRY